MPGRKPCVQLAPLLVDVAQPMLELPPWESGKRPTWKAETIVLPNVKVSGSTSVWCWLVLLVYGSVLTRVSGTFAAAGRAHHRSSPATPTADAASRPAVRR